MSVAVRRHGRISVRTWTSGAPDDETLVLLHPANLGSGCWDAVAARLAERFACIAVDLRGHGDADRGGPYGVAGWADDCAPLLDELAGTTVHLVGASVGAAIAVELTARAPERVRTLTGIGGAYLPAPEDAGELTREIVALGPTEALRRHLVLDALADDAPPALAARVARDLSENDAETVTAIWRAALATDVRPALAALAEVACLAIVGEHDRTCPPAESAWFADATGGRLERLPGVGHLPIYEAPATVAALLTHHIDLHPTRSPTR